MDGGMSNSLCVHELNRNTVQCSDKSPVKIIGRFGGLLGGPVSALRSCFKGCEASPSMVNACGRSLLRSSMAEGEKEVKVDVPLNKFWRGDESTALQDTATSL